MAGTEERKNTYYDDKHWEKYRKTHTGSFTLQRYKGLGEMDATQTVETTMDPDHRRLRLVEIEDARLASSVTEMLMERKCRRVVSLSMKMQ